MRNRCRTLALEVLDMRQLLAGDTVGLTSVSDPTESECVAVQEQTAQDLAAGFDSDFRETSSHTQEVAVDLDDLFDASEASHWSIATREGDSRQVLDDLELRPSFGKPGLLVYSRDGAPPWIGKNVSDSTQDPFGGVNWPSGGIVAHPGEGVGIEMAWTSPADGIATFCIAIRDAHPRGGDGVSFTLEHVSASGTTILHDGIINRGGEAIVQSDPAGVSMSKGDELRLTFWPRGGFEYDSTVVSFTGRLRGMIPVVDCSNGAPEAEELDVLPFELKETIDSIAASLSLDEAIPEPAAPVHLRINDLFQTQDDNPWAVFSRVGNQIVPLPKSATNEGFGISGVELFSHDGVPPWVAINSSSQPIDPFGGVEWPDTLVAMHPGPGVGVGVSWRSPGDGVLELNGNIRDGHPRGGDGVSYLLEHVAPDGVVVLSQGTIGRGGVAAFFDKPVSLSIRQGDQIRLTPSSAPLEYT